MSAHEEVTAFLKAYEAATNTHVFDKVRPLIAQDATYWFSDGSHSGIAQIERAFTKTYNTIREETYRIKDVTWVVLEDTVAVCTYTFLWNGIVGGAQKQGTGRGTNVLEKRHGTWVVVHEHLSTL